MIKSQPAKLRREAEDITRQLEDKQAEIERLRSEI